LNFYYDFFLKSVLLISTFKIKIVETSASYFAFFFLLLYETSMIYGFTRVTQVAPVYEFGGLSFCFFFLIELDFFIVYFFFI
jgi:hypothetical protein